MRYISLFILLSFNASGQALRDINYSFQYNPNEPVEFNISVTKLDNGWTAFFNLSLRDTTQDISQFVIQWDVRKDLSEKEGVAIQAENVAKKMGNRAIEGSIQLPVAADKQYLTTKVLNNAAKRAWIFSTELDPKSPVNAYLAVDGRPVLQSFVKVNTTVNVV
ncbi:MAG TPA: hypothetical protein VFZ52_25120, partial [Chryseolinea sp.]